MDKFYVIKVINSSNGTGFIIDSPTGIIVSLNGLHKDVTQFNSRKAAYDFIRDKKLEKGGAKALILSNEDLIRQLSISQGISELGNEQAYYLENDTEEKLFYDSKLEGYFFQKKDVGYCIWTDMEKLKQFRDVMEFTVATHIRKIERKSDLN